jgi:hypothetical protein
MRQPFSVSGHETGVRMRACPAPRGAARGRCNWGTWSVSTEKAAAVYQPAARDDVFGKSFRICLPNPESLEEVIITFDAARSRKALG